MCRTMREILFRAKRLDNGEWVEGFYNHIPCGRFGVDEHMIQTVLENGKIGMLHDVDPSTVGQYTGLEDKNGKRIFEGDILKSHYDSLFPDDVTFDLVVFCDSAWCIQQKGFEPVPACADMISKLSEVAGNIYDNPELLERGSP